MPKIVESAKLEFEEKPTPRAGRIQWKTLAKGVPGTLNNFEFNVYRFHPGYGTPRHRHNFEQIRFALNGDMTYDPDKELSPGSLTYFPEGAYYGPQNTPSASDVLLLQFGGASGQGFHGQEELFAAREEMMKTGEFKGGVYTYYKDGKKHNQDAPEAVFEHIYKRKVEYVKPRIPEPVKFDPSAFSWIVSDIDGIEEKLLGVLTERKVKSVMYRAVKPAKMKLGADERQLFFTLNGEFSIEGRKCGPMTSIFCEKGESSELALEPGWESLMIRLP